MDFHPYTTKQSVNSAITIGFIDDFLKNALPDLKVIVLDNASIHHSEEFKDQIQRWEEEENVPQLKSERRYRRLS